MTEDNSESQGNGAVPGVITITIALTPTLQGYQMQVTVNPRDVFPDTIIDACERAGRYFADRVKAAHVAQTLEQNRAAREQAARLVGPGGQRFS